MKGKKMLVVGNAEKIAVQAGGGSAGPCSTPGDRTARAFRHVPQAFRHVPQALRHVLGWLRNFPRDVKDWAGRSIAPVGAPVIVVSLLGIAVTIVAFQAVAQYSRELAQREFDRQSAHYLMILSKGIDRYVELAEEASQLLKGPAKEADRWEFFEFAKAALPRYSAVQSLIWVPRVEAAEIFLYEQTARDDGLFDYHSSRYDPDGNPVAVDQSKEIFPAFFIEPYPGNEALLGVDLASMPEFAPVLDRARAAGRMAAGFSGESGQGSERGTLMLLALPVYADGESPEIADSPGLAPEGFLVVTLRFADILEQTLNDFTTPAWLDTYVYAVGDNPGKRLLHYRPSPLRSETVTPSPGAESDGTHQAKVSYEIGGVELSLVIRPVPGTLRSDAGVLPLGVALVGFLLTALLAQQLHTLRSRQKSAETIVERRTEELFVAQESNAELEEEILERERMEGELRAAKRQAESANNAKSEFLAVVSHELRTPLNAIIGFSEMLMYETFGPLGDERYNDYVEDIRGSGLHLLSLINNILDLSKVEADKFELLESDVDIASTVADALKFVKGRADAAGIHTETEFSELLPGVRADQRAVMQILVNLLTNAVKFTPRDGRVMVGAELVDDGSLQISVSDTGIGIPENELLRVLEPFAQTDTTVSREYEGTGLGLPLSKRLIELHEGTLEIESEPGLGTTVRIEFPPARVLGAGAEVRPH